MNFLCIFFCNGCGMPAGNAYPSGHLVPFHIVGLACAPIVETSFHELAMSYSTFHREYPLVLSRFCLDKRRGRGALMYVHVFVLDHIVRLCYRTAWWMFTKLGRDEVLVAPHLWLDFPQTSPRGGSRARQKYVNEGSLLQRTASSDWKATVTKRNHSNDLKACGKKG